MYKMVSLQTNASKVALAGLLAASLCGGSMMVGASTAYAGEVTISKTATETDANALSYNAFKLFNATKNDDGSVSSITWVNDDTKNAVLDVITEKDPAYAGGTNAQAAAEWIASKVTGTGSTTIVDASSIANQIAVAVSGKTATETLGSGTATTLESGYWLFVTNSNSTQNAVDNAGTSPIFAVVGGDALTITPKTGTPTVNKTIKNDQAGEYGKVADSQVGQVVEYKLAGTVASNIATYSTYSYRFDDELSDGIELTSTDDVKVTIDGTDVTAKADIHYAHNTLTVAFDNLLAAKDGINASSNVTVTYKAKLTSAAVIGGAGNSNTVTLRYSNNPGTKSEGTSIPSTARDYAFKLHLVKSDKATNQKLAGAKFTIQPTEANGAESKNLYVQADGTLDQRAYEFETSADGTFDVAGLDAGTYTVTEVAVPSAAGSPDAAYKPLSSSFTFTIAPEYNADTQALTNLGLTVAGNANAIAGLDTSDNNTLDADNGSAVNTANGMVNVTVANEKAIKLPLTGEQGIALVMGAGLVIVAVSAVSLSRRRREED
ncbi:isopeptide-forming domain-containing fimbrial protein [uncultured Slackia sp.]|uniref:isopeptide-forming domain-containing fimbrial protein n=1 Tax=uncultured Slackia sp. TaxID=665903 RepID=UPI0026768C58|nr:isopeptide-forming domain-containing fimbrial protein [uncultured Slackia sp.]